MNNAFSQSYALKSKYYQQTLYVYCNETTDITDRLYKHSFDTSNEIPQKANKDT